jgi:hypothetical protein
VPRCPVARCHKRVAGPGSVLDSVMLRSLLLSLLILAAGCAERQGVGVAAGGTWGESGRTGSMMSLSIPIGP